jgi:hypothetical protein
MKFLLLLTLWATLLFVPSWIVTNQYQHAVAAAAAHLVAPRGSEIELVDVELFYPFDMSVFLALCLASSWVSIRRRLRAVAIGVPVMLVIELLSVVLAMEAMLMMMASPRATPADADQVGRFATGVIRMTGLVGAAGVWFYTLGRDRLSLVARTRLGAC